MSCDIDSDSFHARRRRQEIGTGTKKGGVRKTAKVRRLAYEKWSNQELWNMVQNLANATSQYLKDGIVDKNEARLVHGHIDQIRLLLHLRSWRKGKRIPKWELQ